MEQPLVFRPINTVMHRECLCAAAARHATGAYSMSTSQEARLLAKREAVLRGGEADAASPIEQGIAVEHGAQADAAVFECYRICESRY